ncbi:MAG: hypothetical protein EOM21_20090 [Gammaproteobacteria bacterium]|nr:hypothetical protein [Gammaproteobacteria bacterium]
MTKEELDAAIADLKKVECGDTAMDWFERYANSDGSLVVRSLQTLRAIMDMVDIERPRHCSGYCEGRHDFADEIYAKIGENHD